MIFVTVGTHEQQFNRLVKAVDELRADGILTEPVFIQTGYSTYEPIHCDHSRFVPFHQMLLLLGPSGVGKTEVAKILCEAIAPCQPLPKVNLGNYSSKDSLNSLIGSPRGYMGSEEGELGKKIDSSDAGILLVDEFEKAEPAVWNFFLDLLETGSFTDSQGMEHDLRGFIIVFTTNCPLGKINETFPAELLSRFNLMSHFSKLSVSDKKFFVERYVSMFAKKYRETAPSGLPTLPDDIADRAMMEIDIEATENIRILKNTTRSWISEFVEKARKSSSIATQPSIINTQT